MCLVRVRVRQNYRNTVARKSRYLELFCYCYDCHYTNRDPDNGARIKDNRAGRNSTRCIITLIGQMPFPLNRGSSSPMHIQVALECSAAFLGSAVLSLLQLLWRVYTTSYLHCMSFLYDWRHRSFFGLVWRSMQV